MKMFNQIAPIEAGLPRWKRALDITLILLDLPVLLPVSLLIAALIRVVSKGPLLFKQHRVGRGGENFLCYKFRTMHVGAETKCHQGHLHQLMQSDVPMTKMDARGDARIIPFGVVLRATGLDELPQLINVWCGDMSIVGPRPCLPYEAELYQPWQRERFNATPGLTGLWQVSGKNRTTFTEMMRLDIEYSRRLNLWLDLGIIFKTVPALLIQVTETQKKKSAPQALTGKSEEIFPTRTITKTLTVEREAIFSAHAIHH
jgi:exopolysaccharide production protein ExoY